MKIHFIKSGQWTVVRGSGIIRTDLGSCVSLCLWDGLRHVGGMNHYLLPDTGSGTAGEGGVGRMANQRLLEEMLMHGARLENLQGAVIGGGRLNSGYDIFAIGEGNVQVAEEALAAHGIPLVFRSVGGNSSRSLQLDVHHGRLLIREIALKSGAVRNHEFQFDKGV